MARILIEPVWMFYPKYAWEIVSKQLRLVKGWIDLALMLRAVRRDPNRARYRYMDAALMPVTDEETETLEIFTHSAAARGAAIHQHKVAGLTSGARVPQGQTA